VTISATSQGLRMGVATSTSRPAVPFDGQVIYMTDVDQTAVWDGSQWTVLAPIAGGRNKIINGDFKVWQRGTSYTVVPNNYGAADRYVYWHNGSTAGTNTVSRQTFTPGAAPVAGYESEFFQRITTTTLGTGQTVIDCWQRIEDARTFAGQSVTVSFWAKTSGTFNFSAQLGQRFGSGGSGNVDTIIISSAASSGSWTRYSGTATLPSISGKTVGSSSYLQMIIRFSSPTNGATFDIWGVQVEAGSVATPFEVEDYGTTLAKCQRYYYRLTPGGTLRLLAFGAARATTVADVAQPFPVEMRIAPTALEQSGTANEYEVARYGVGTFPCSAVPVIAQANTQSAVIIATVASGLASGLPVALRTSATYGATAYLGWSAELL
tara:strand:- start:153 stop:1289 length:1137 start_codon:yes stop_codon:yes gene_type:complete